MQLVQKWFGLVVFLALISRTGFAGDWRVVEFPQLGAQILLKIAPDSPTKVDKLSQKLQKGKIYTLEAHVKPVDLAKWQSFNGKLELTEFDAQMPGHGHGMVGKSSVTAAGNLVWLIKPVMFHMDGRWKISLKFEGKDKKGGPLEYVASSDLMLESAARKS